MTSKKITVRDKEETKARILAAVGKLLAESGFNQLGINAIAREAGVDKVLIYRYFENLPTLLQTFGQEGDYWITAEELIDRAAMGEEMQLSQWMYRLLVELQHDLHDRPITQEIMRWEFLEANQLTQKLATVRDRTALNTLQFLQQTCSFPADLDIPAISAVLVAGIVYLTLRTKVSSSFMGIDFSTPAGWQRIEAAIAVLLEATLSKDDANTE